MKQAKIENDITYSDAPMVLTSDKSWFETKTSNPKQHEGIKKIQYHVIPAPVLAELSVALLLGATKYGSHNWRVDGVKSSTYYDALLRHITAWWEGCDMDKESEVSHLAHAMACLAILMDAKDQGKLIDDRPPKSNEIWQTWYNVKTEALSKKFPDSKKPFTEKKL